ncbi:probable disease resistance protein At5g45490 [Fagus crenata]
MAQEIDEYLMEQFRKGLEEGENSGSKIRLRSHFQVIKGLLDKIPSNSGKREKLYYLNNVLTECQMLSWSDKLTECSIRRKLKDLTEELKGLANKTNRAQPNGGANELANNAQPNGGASSSNGRQVTRWSSRVVDASKVHGFDNEVISLEKLLLRQGSDDLFKTIGIIGKAGIGKTTLCQVIFNKQEVQNYFLPRIWVCMSIKPDEDQGTRVPIVKRMLEYLGVDEEIIEKVHNQHNLKGLLHALHLELVGKRYLIVFDDARDTDTFYEELNSSLTRDGNWDSLAYGLPKGCGGAVIVTSRNEELAKNMVGEENLRSLLPSTDPESFWLIFKDAVEQGTDEKERKQFNPSNAQDLKKQILQKCDGLPLAAKMLGEIMRKELQNEANGNVNQQAHAS